MEKQFISLKDACEYSNKSMSTLRRLVNELKDNQPNKLKYEDLKNGSKKILIEVNYLNEYYNLNKDNQPNNTNQNTHSISNSIDRSNDNAIIQVYENLIKMLNNDLEAKNRQIENLTETIKIKEENNRVNQNELNTIINNMTNKLALETKEVNEVRRKWWQRNK